MSERCCCGKVEVEDDCVASIFNDYQHDKLGTKGAFCGPKWMHEVRDANARVKALEKAVQFLIDIWDGPLRDEAYDNAIGLAEKELRSIISK